MPEFLTRTIEVDREQPDAQSIEIAADLLRSGEVVAFPTETVYGLGADVFRLPAVERIFAVKGRPFTDPLIVHIADLQGLEGLVETMSVEAQRLADIFWPGPLTMLLPKRKRVSDRVTAGLPSVGVRMPLHPVARALIRAVGSPLAAPSANRFKHISPTTAAHVLDDLGGRIPLILDGGSSDVGVESTVLDLSTPVPRILRPGGVSLEALRAVLPAVQVRPSPASFALDDDEERMQAPGQMLTHYAPMIPLFLFEEGPDMYARMQADLQRRQRSGERVGLLVADEDLPVFQSSGAVLEAVGSLHQPEQIAAALFAGLRNLEGAGVHVILSRTFHEQGMGLAIQDRLFKAASSKIVQR